MKRGLVVLAILAIADRAEGRDEKPRVAIELAGCDETLAREARRIAAIELRAALVETAPDESTTRVIATCRAEVSDLRVRDPMTGKSLERSIALSQQAPSARARLLALAIAELVAASWSELESNPEMKAPAATPLAPPSAREAALGAITPTPVELAAVLDAHLLASRDLLFGGGARAPIWLSRLFVLRSDALVHYGEVPRPSGSVSVTMTSLSAAVGISLTTAALRWQLSLGARGGYIWMSGVGNSGATRGERQEGPWIGPELALDVAAWPRARIHPTMSLAAGTHLVGVRGTVSDGDDVTAANAWGAISLGAALR